MPFYFLTHSICRLEWKPLFWKSLSHTHSYSPITVESDFNNPLYEAGVSVRLIIYPNWDYFMSACFCIKWNLFHLFGNILLFWILNRFFLYWLISHLDHRIHGSMKCPFKGENVLPRIKKKKNTERFKSFGKQIRPHSPFLSFILNYLCFTLTVSLVYQLWKCFIFDLLHWYGGLPNLGPTSRSNVCIIRTGALRRVTNWHQGEKNNSVGVIRTWEGKRAKSLENLAILYL